MIFVIDTNIIIKYALNDSDAVQFINHVIQMHQIAITPKIFNEYIRILKRKKLKISPEVASEVIDLLKNHSNPFDDSFIRFNKDREDEKFLACAVVSEADYLVTEDKAIKNAQWKVQSKIISLGVYLKLLE